METLGLLFVLVMLVAAAGYVLSVSWRDFTRHLVAGRKQKKDGL